MAKKVPPKYFLGVAGGSAGGKSTFCDKLVEALPKNSVALIHVDSYYRAQDQLSPKQRSLLNYDHPDAVEFELLVRHLTMLRDGDAFPMPVYDFKTHNRTKKRLTVEPAPIVIVEGILSLYPEELRTLYDLKIFVDASESVRFERRLLRDTKERGRTEQSVRRQWEATVQPMYLAYCEPCRKFANLVIDGSGNYDSAVKEVLSCIRSQPGIHL